MHEKKRIALLGGTGFAGQNVAAQFAADGREFAIFCRATGCDLLDLPAAQERIASYHPTHIVNCAAVVGSVNYVSDFAADVVDVNMRLVLNIYKIARAIPYVVVINPIANCAYPGLMDRYEEAGFWSGPVHPSVLSYGSTRRMIDVIAKCYHSQFGVKSSNVFVPNMYGPYDSTDPNKTHALNALVIKFVTAMRKGLPEIEIWGTGLPIREWLYVKDFARVVERLVQSPECLINPVNIGQDHGLSVDQLVAIIAESVGFKGRLVKNTHYGDGAPKKVMDGRLFRTTFPGFQFTPFAQGLAETIEYYEQVL